MTTSVLLEALRQAHARLLAAPVEGWGAASDLELRELVAAATALRQAAERQAALGAGEVARRSRPEHGLAGFAQRAGHRTVEEFLRVETGVSARDASSTARVGEIAGAGGVLGDAILNGRISVAAADAINSGLGAPTAAVPAEVLDQAAERLCNDSGSLDPDRLQRRAREVRDELDEAGVADREAQRRSARSLRLVRQTDGMTRIIWLLDPESAAIVTEVYDRATSPRRGGPSFVDPEQRAVATRIGDDLRSTEQLASDSFTELLRQSASVDRHHLVGSGTPAVRVLVTASALEARHGHGVLESGESISMASVDRLVCSGGCCRTFSTAPVNCSTWGASSGSTTGDSGMRSLCVTAGACGRDATGRRPGARLTTSGTGLATTVERTWPTGSCCADIITCDCTTRTGGSIGERDAIGWNRHRIAAAWARCSRRSPGRSGNCSRRGEPSGPALARSVLARSVLARASSRLRGERGRRRAEVQPGGVWAQPRYRSCQALAETSVSDATWSTTTRRRAVSSNAAAQSAWKPRSRCSGPVAHRWSASSVRMPRWRT